MDDEIEELESVLSQHFGKTPVSTPYNASQELCDSPNGNDDIDTDDGPHDINVIVQGRVRDYLSHQERVVEEDEESDELTMLMIRRILHLVTMQNFRKYRNSALKGVVATVNALKHLVLKRCSYTF
ncbi:hypothetical protein DPMN_057306 [Dreissena polymorpha]|uniref:Uncharacterized protein n=1 Tax=Dreissena polymorpha TaxID=45954 RepID=A0A9D4HEL8_DREPO|nr:hypothetical protein DPMN_057306 [Dreissena polymorpha]